MNAPIERLQRVSLREVWKHEAHDFTTWLEENIDVLTDALGMDLVTVDREHPAGSFSIDLVAEDGNGGTVVIENQLEKTNHDHLGKLITYLVAMSARAAIWIVKDPRPEHVAAVGWLNESTTVDFYLLKLEAVRIGDSPPAPLLTTIVGPAQDTTIHQQKKDLAERYGIRRNWWTQIVAHPEAKSHAHITPGIYSFISASAGVRGLNFIYGVTQQECGAELYIDLGKENVTENKAVFDQLFDAREQIEALVPYDVSWERLEQRRASRIRIVLDGGYRSPEEEWSDIQERQVAAMNALAAALRPQLKNLRFGN